MATIPPTEPTGTAKTLGSRKILQVTISESAYRRIHAAAGQRLVSPGRVVEELAETLPPVQDAA